MGKMKIILDMKTNISKEEFIIKSLEEDIKEDIIKNDTKSLKYHSLALKEHKDYLKKIKN